MSRRSTLLFLALCAISLVPCVCPAAPLEAIPDDAVAVFRFRRPQGLVKKSISIAAKIDKEYETQLTEFSSQIGTFIGNTKVEGVDPNGDWWIAILEGKSGENVVVYGIPFKDKEETMKTAISGRFKSVKHEKYLFYTQDDGALQKIQARIDDEGKSISTLIDRASMALINKSDVGIYVNIKRTMEKYKPQLDAVSEELDKAFGDWKNLAPKVEGMDLEPLYQMYGDAAKTLLQGVRDCEGYTVTVEISFKGAVIEQYLRLAAGSPTDKLLQAQKPSDLKDLEKLPADQLAYFGVHGDFAAITQWSSKFAAQLIKDESTRKSMQAVADAQSQMTYGAYLAALDLDDPSQGALRSTIVTVASPIDKLREVTRQSTMLAQLGSVGGITPKIELKQDAEKVGSYSADIFTVRTEVEGSKLPAEVIQAMQKSNAAIYGPDGITQRLVYLGDRLLQTIGGGTKAMETAIAAQSRSPLSTDKGTSPFEVARKSVADKANFVAIVDAARLAVNWSKVMAHIQPAEGEVARIMALELKPSYLATSVTIGAGSVASTTNISFEQAQGLSEVLKPYIPTIMETIWNLGMPGGGMMGPPSGGGSGKKAGGNSRRKD